MISKARGIIIAAAVVLLSVCGTGVYTGEPSETRLVRTIAVDKTETGVKIAVRFASDAEDGENKLRYAEGASLSDAVSAMKADGTAYRSDFSHTEDILVGESAAREGILPSVLDYVSRSGDMRFDMGIFIARGMEASALLSETTEGLQSLTRSADLRTDGHAYTCLDAAARGMRLDCALILAVSLADESPVSADFAVVKDGVLIGFTDKNATKGVCIAENTGKYESVTLSCDGVPITVGIVSVKTRVRPVYEGGAVTGVHIEIKTEANIEQMGGNAPVMEESMRIPLEKALANLQKSRVESAVKLSRETGCDFLRLIERARLGRARAIFSDIVDFQSMTVSVSSEAKILRSYDAVQFMGGNES